MVRVLLALTVGLLVFLAVDAAIEGFDAGRGLRRVPSAGRSSCCWAPDWHSWRSPGSIASSRVARRTASGAGGAAGCAWRCMIAIGIGLHNLGEGLVIGSAYAVGELALGAALVVGFAAHNTTEGLAIVAPLAGAAPVALASARARDRSRGPRPSSGALVGASVNNAALAALLFGVGVGRHRAGAGPARPVAAGPDSGRHLDPAVVGGLAPGWPSCTSPACWSSRSTPPRGSAARLAG